MFVCVSPVCTVKKETFALLSVSADGFASLLNLETGTIDDSLPFPPPAHLRAGGADDDKAYAKMVSSTLNSEPWCGVMDRAHPGVACTCMTVGPHSRLRRAPQGTRTSSSPS